MVDEVVDSLMTQTGNPNLKSAVRHTASVSMSFWDRLTIRPTLKFTPDRISTIYKQEESGYSSTFTNVNTRQYAVMAMYEQPIGEYIRFSNILVHYYDRVSNSNHKNSYYGWILDSEVNYYNPVWNMGVEVGYYRNMDKGVLLQGYQMVNMDGWLFTFNKQFWKKQASLMLTCFSPIS